MPFGEDVVGFGFAELDVLGAAGVAGIGLAAAADGVAVLDVTDATVLDVFAVLVFLGVAGWCSGVEAVGL